MKWKFWKKDTEKDDDTTTITVVNMSAGTQVYVQATTSKKALKLYRKLTEKK